MKVTEVETALVALPLPRPFRAAIHLLPESVNTLITVRTDQGLTGISYLFAYHRGVARAMRAMVDGLAELLVGQDPLATERHWQRLWTAVNLWGQKGITVMAIAGLDIALWDLKGKALGLPLCRLLGGCRDRIPAYGSGGGFENSVDDLKREVSAFLEQGFTAYKMKVGRPDPEEDVARVRAVRAAMGRGPRLMVDGNQGWRPWEAIAMANRLREFDLFWLEEPVPATDIAGHAEVAAALDIPIATGEDEYTKLGFRALIEAKAADILTPNLQRVGGITEWMKLAALAEAWHLPIASHLFLEIQAQLLSATPTGLILEYLPRWTGLFNEPPAVEDGCLLAPEHLGLGLTFNAATISRFALAEGGEGSGVGRQETQGKTIRRPHNRAPSTQQSAPCTVSLIAYGRT